jgi:TPR repeat protein
MARTTPRSGPRALLSAAALLAAATAASAQNPIRPPAGRYALLVGVRQYDKNELRDLPYAEPDVTELARVLRDAGYRPENVVLMTQTAGAEYARSLPLAANVRKELRLLLRTRSRDDTVLVALAGHGVQFKGSDEQFFCPMDARLADRETLISLTELYRELERCPARVKLLLADCCRNDPQSDHSRAAGMRLESVTRPQTLPLPAGVSALFSCSAGERAFEDPKLGHGVFFHFVIEGLKGQADLDRDRKVSLEELTLYTKRQVADFVRAEYGQPQTPEQKGSVKGLVPLVNLQRPRRGVLRAAMRSVDPALAQKLGLPKPEGVAIEGVLPGGPAEAAGLRRDDVIVAVNGEPVVGLPQLGAVGGLEPGAEVSFDLIRAGQRLTMKIALAERLGEAELFRQLLKLAEAGEPWAQRDVGLGYKNGQGVAPNDREAVRWLRRAADQGEVRSQYWLGWSLRHGRGGPPNEAEAAQWYRKAAEAGYPPAQADLGWLYESGRGVGTDYAEAAKWHRAAAERGVTGAEFNLGQAYLAGRGVPADAAEAAKWYRRAADRGHADAQNRLGLLCEKGQGVPRNEAEAAEWYRRAAEQGSAAAQVNLGRMYASGRGVAKDEAEAVKWYREAAEQNRARAQRLLGQAYDAGRGVPPDQAEAVKWFHRAAEQNDAPAEYSLGSAYELGRGVAKDKAEALKWYRKAAGHGHKEAEKKLQALTAKP